MRREHRTAWSNCAVSLQLSSRHRVPARGCVCRSLLCRADARHTDPQRGCRVPATYQDDLMHREVEIDGVRLHLSQPHEPFGQWIGQSEILKQLLACWMVVGEKDLPLTPRLIGTPGIGKTALGIAGAQTLGRELYIYQ